MSTEGVDYVRASIFVGGAFDKDETRPIANKLMVFSFLTAVVTLASSVADFSNVDLNNEIIDAQANFTGEDEGKIAAFLYMNLILRLLVGLMIPVFGFCAAKKSDAQLAASFCGMSSACTVCTWFGIASLLFSSVGDLSCSEYNKLGLDAGFCVAKTVILFLLGFLYAADTYYARKLKNKLDPVVVTQSYSPNTVAVIDPYNAKMQQQQGGNPYNQTFDSGVRPVSAYPVSNGSYPVSNSSYPSQAPYASPNSQQRDNTTGSKPIKSMYDV
mmetsp:Transcript_11750/g.13526  ORF Transcript_11750/g.13526 Transcript_11750/m.13526 type:complete len:271 (-) Transcript_11750:152-964(-)